MKHALPPNEAAAAVDADRAHVWHHLIQHKPFETSDPRIMVEGRGLRLWDVAGREYLDGNSGNCWVVNVGYGRERIVDAMREQLLRMPYFANSAGSIPGAAFARMLVDRMPGLSRVYYCSSGSEAIEKAFKMIRQIAHKRHGGRKHKILYRERDYHGSTIGALSAGGQIERSAQYGPFAPGFVAVPHCLEYRAQVETEDYGAWAAEQIEAVILREGPDTVGGLCLEPITAGGGIITPPSGYWERVQDICAKYEILLIIDEVVCGAGRTGAWFGYQNYGIRPDFVAMAKGVASGYAALGCMVTTEAVFEMFKSDPSDPLDYFRDISSFGGCTAGPTAAIESFAIIEQEGLLANARSMGARLLENLRRIQERRRVIGDVRGEGLFAGAELVADRTTKQPAPEAMVRAVVEDCLAQGVIIGATNRSLAGSNNCLCIAPSLSAAPDEIDAMTDAVDAALARTFP